MLDFRDVYDLRGWARRDALHVEPRGDVSDSYEIARGDVEVRTPLIFDQMVGCSGDAICDLVTTSLVDVRIVSGRLLAALGPFSGWGAFPVEVYDKRGKYVPDLHGLKTTGRCGSIDNSRSQPEWRPPRAKGGMAYRVWVGLYCDSQTWDGSDLFMPLDTALILVREPVKASLERAGITNVRFVRATEFERGPVEMGLPVEAGFAE